MYWKLARSQGPARSPSVPMTPSESRLAKQKLQGAIKLSSLGEPSAIMKQDSPRLVGNMLNPVDIFATQNCETEFKCSVFVTKTKLGLAFISSFFPQVLFADE